VRNRWDESVEVLAEGEHDKLEKLLAALRHGPSLARVTQVQYEWGEASGAYNRFQALPTE
jgi:acylphosphatase